MPTLQTPNEEPNSKSSHSTTDATSEPSQTTDGSSESKQPKESDKSLSKRGLQQKSTSAPKGAKRKKSSEKSAKTKSSKELPQDKPIIDPASYHRKFCMKRKKKKMQSMRECMSKFPTDMAFPPSDHMAGMKMPFDMNDMRPPPDRLGQMPMDSDMMDGNSMFDRLPSKDVVGGMMDRMMSRLNSSGGMGMMGDPMSMNGRMMGMGGGMGMSDRMMAMGMGLSPNELQHMSPSARRMALGFSMGMQRGMGHFNPTNMMKGDTDGKTSMMPSAGDKTPGNLQELREMMGKDRGMDHAGTGMFSRMGSAVDPNLDSTDDFTAAMFNRIGSKGSAASSNKGIQGKIANQLLNTLESKVSASSNNSKIDRSDAPKIIDRRGSSDSAKESRGSPSIGESYMAGPLLPTPAEFKPSFKKSYKDISFSPLDNLDRGLMERMMALQESNPNGNSMEAMPGMPLMPNAGSKLKISDLAFSPKSPNPKKSLLERQRMMDLEMKGQLDEAMANFSRFQKKYSGGSGGNSSSMLGMKEIASASTGEPHNGPMMKSMDSNIPTKSTKATKKKKSKKVKHEKQPKGKGNDDPRKPKRPFR